MAEKTAPLVYLGICGNVMALDRETGNEAWSTELKGADFVHVVLDGDRILAATKGELYCLRAADGKKLWHNKLPGLGRGFMSIATAHAPSPGAVVQAAAKKKKDEEDSAAVIIG